MEHVFEALFIGAFFMLTVILNTISVIHSRSKKTGYKIIHGLSWFFSIIVIFIGILGREEYTSLNFEVLLKEPSYLTILMAFVIVCFIRRTYLIIKQINAEDANNRINSGNNEPFK